jgi:hypothetical protein
MATYLVQKTFYLSTTVEAPTWQEAMERAEDMDLGAWDYADSETPTVVDISDEV